MTDTNNDAKTDAALKAKADAKKEAILKAKARAKANAANGTANNDESKASKKKSRVKKTKKNTQGEQKFSFGLAVVTLALIFGYFIQSAIEIYHQEPIKIAIKRLNSDTKATSESTKKSISEAKVKNQAKDKANKSKDN